MFEISLIFLLPSMNIFNLYTKQEAVLKRVLHGSMMHQKSDVSRVLRHLMEIRVARSDSNRVSKALKRRGRYSNGIDSEIEKNGSALGVEFILADKPPYPTGGCIFEIIMVFS